MDKKKLKSCEISVKRALANKFISMEDYYNGLPLLKEVVKESKDKDDIKNFISISLRYAAKLSDNKSWLEVANIYKDIMIYNEVPDKLYRSLGLCMSALKAHREAIDCFKIYEELHPDDNEICSFIGELAANELQDYALAIEYYEKLLARGVDNFSINNMLGHLYSKLYRDSHKEEQLKYFLKAYKFDPENRVVINNLAYTYGKFQDIKEADEFYAKLLQMNPMHSEIHSYGAYLVKNKRFKAGFRLLRHRFYKEDLTGAAFGNITKNMNKVWKVGERLEDKRVLIHYEQGFGDSIMFARFIKDLQGRCKSLEIVLQEGLIDLFKDSGFNMPIKTLEELNMDDYDIIIPMMDLAVVFGLKADFIPYSKGYLQVPEEKVKEYRKNHIKRSKRFKVGFAFEGSPVSLVTKRDIPLKEFYDLMNMKNIDLYCFQVGDIFKQLDKVPKGYKFTKLGDTFKTWEDTACAMKSMDLIITSDNGVMNLAGALGVKTFGIFNSLTEWRWIETKGDNVVWYDSVKPYQCPSTDDWHSVMQEVTKEVEKLANAEEK